jgi:MFS family permease
MNLKKVFLCMFLSNVINILIAQNPAYFKKTNDLLSFNLTDSVLAQIPPFTLLDSLKNKYILNSIFHKTINLDGINNIIGLTEFGTERDLPFLKQIKNIPITNDGWKIWFILSIILYLALVRLNDQRNFEQDASVVFDLLFLSSIKRLKDSKLTWTSLHLFIIYILSFSLILIQFFQNNQIFNVISYQILVWIIAAGILIIYIIKFLVYFLVGYLLNDTISSAKMIINTIQISNFLGFILLIFSIFYIYIIGLQLTETIFFSMVAIFFTAIVYRIVRYLLNQISSGSLPFFYLFIYLCALEISPWLIFIKILNSYLS